MSGTEPIDAVGQAELVRTGQVSPLELVDQAIARIEALDGEINAVIHRRFEQARAEAKADLGDGAFRGVPITLKDLWPASAGDPFHQGVAALAAIDHRQPDDSNLVKAYRRAGFVIIGRTNTSELGLAATTEPAAYGPTRNPFKPSHGAGGSSGGAAASVAAGMTAIANASDGGGSIRIPAAHNNLVGLKPSRGRVSMGPLQDEWTNSVQHVVCHSMRDTATVLDVTAVPFPTDGVVAPHPGRPFASFLDTDPGRLRVGTTTESRPDYLTDPVLVAAVERVARLLDSLGHDITPDHSPAQLHEPVPSLGLLMMVGSAARVAAIAELVGRDLVPGDIEAGTWQLAEMAKGVTGIQVAQAQADQMRHRHAMASWWADGNDLLLTPTTALPPPPIGELTPTDQDPFRAQMLSIPYAVFTSAFNSTGQPALSIPAGFTRDGLPIAVQLVAAYGREDLLISVGRQLERELNWSATRPERSGQPERDRSQ